MNSIQASQIMGGNGGKGAQGDRPVPDAAGGNGGAVRFLKLPAGTDVWGTGPWARGYGASAGELRDGCLRHGYPATG